MPSSAAVVGHGQGSNQGGMDRPDKTRLDRLQRALLINLEIWIENVEEIAAEARPGNKARALGLLRNMMQAQMAIRRMLDEPEESGGREAAD